MIQDYVQKKGLFKYEFTGLGSFFCNEFFHETFFDRSELRHHCFKIFYVQDPLISTLKIKECTNLNFLVLLKVGKPHKY